MWQTELRVTRMATSPCHQLVDIQGVPLLYFDFVWVEGFP